MFEGSIIWTNIESWRETLGESWRKNPWELRRLFRSKTEERIFFESWREKIFLESWRESIFIESWREEFVWKLKREFNLRAKEAPNSLRAEKGASSLRADKKSFFLRAEEKASSLREDIMRYVSESRLCFLRHFYETLKRVGNIWKKISSEDIYYQLTTNTTPSDLRDLI